MHHQTTFPRATAPAADSGGLAVPFTAVAALVDHRRPVHRSDAVGAWLAAHGHVTLTLLEVGEGRRVTGSVSTAPVRLQLPADDVARAVTSRLQGRDGALLVVDAHGGGRPGGALFDEDVERILTRLRRPVLVLGPHSAMLDHGTRLVVPLDGSGLASTSLRTVASWVERFPTSGVTLVALDVPTSWPQGGPQPAPDDADRVLAVLRERDLDVALERRDGSDPVAAVLRTVDRSSIVVAPSSRWPSEAGHWFTTTRQLIRHAPCAVLADPAPSA